MSNQNNMQAFITLTDTVHNCDIEINPAFIIYMQRTTHVETGMPATIINLTTGAAISVWQTPEQIAQLQIEATEKLMLAVVNMTAKIMENINELGEW